MIINKHFFSQSNGSREIKPSKIGDESPKHEDVDVELLSQR
jgi:hypothetical protein